MKGTGGHTWGLCNVSLEQGTLWASDGPSLILSIASVTGQLEDIFYRHAGAQIFYNAEPLVV